MFLNQNLRLFPIQHGYTSTTNLCHICPAHPFPKHSLFNNAIYQKELIFICKKKLYHNLCIRVHIYAYYVYCMSTIQAYHFFGGGGGGEGGGAGRGGGSIKRERDMKCSSVWAL